MIHTLVTILVFCNLMGWLFRRIGQPAVIGEIVGGLLLGPSFLGFFFPEASSILISSSMLPSLGSLASLGVVLYMFLVGLELNLEKMKDQRRDASVISPVAVIVPFFLGTLLAFVLYDMYSKPEVSFYLFAIFIGVSMSITAFPVLARILKEKNLTHTKLGRLALACAAIDDALAWCLLAVVAGLTNTGHSNIGMVFAGTALFAALMMWVAKPLMLKYLPQKEGLFLPLVIFALLCATATDAIGIHALFGAFLAGVVVPAEHLGAKEVESKLQDVLKFLLLPLFFAYSGLRTEILLLDSWTDWIFTGFIILVAIGGKFGGTVIAARFSNYSWKDSSILGAMMNTRGLVELVVLNVGLDLGLLSPRLFSMLVLMALVTTFMTSPWLSLLNRFKDRPSYDI